MPFAQGAESGPLSLWERVRVRASRLANPPIPPHPSLSQRERGLVSTVLEQPDFSAWSPRLPHPPIVTHCLKKSYSTSILVSMKSPGRKCGKEPVHYIRLLVETPSPYNLRSRRRVTRGSGVIIPCRRSNSVTLPKQSPPTWKMTPDPFTVPYGCSPCCSLE